ncbi:flagellin [Aliiroseovarius sediminis]|uniref:flagellin n=1 Tax=Aliiroseovarius sediminis TaxID=2925839 RepID=UPI0023AB270D|nr:flagellin [Aliiroseovarius sediminis]
MSSILTNNSAMVALQTLKSINSNLASTQAEISTGKSVGSAKDNAAVWAISKVMEADVKGFKGISDSLSLGESTVAVARQASETVTDLLTEIKSKIVASQEDNVDRDKIQTDIVALRNQITSVVGAAQFNGLNLVDGSQTGTNVNTNSGIDVLSSLDRKADGSVVTSSIGVDAQNLSLTAGVALAGTAAAVGTDAGTAGVIDANDGGTNDSITMDTFAFLGGGAAVKPDTAGINNADPAGLLVGDQLSLTIGSVQGTYVVKEGDTAQALVAGMKNALISQGLDSNSFSMDADTNTGHLVITNETNAAAAFSFSATRGSGGLAELASINVSNAAGADAALGAIENMIQTSIDAAASFGSVEGRIEIQSDFVGKLSDSLKSGIGAMVDADMEAASARLQALQVQQQLGTQALSIANQAPQSILSLFR